MADVGQTGASAAGRWIDPADYETDRLKFGAIKFVTDGGSIQGYTGFLGHPHHVPYHGDEDYCGFPNIELDA